MAVWALADPHLSFGVPNKQMDPFGPGWRDHAAKIARSWRECVAAQDLVLIAGDISWAMRIEEALPDLAWLDALPGTKVMIRGNHDFWWAPSKMAKVMPPSLHFIQNNSFTWQGVAIGGARLWDSDEYRFDAYIHFKENPLETPKRGAKEDAAKIFAREIERLKLSLKQLDPHAHTRIAMTHYPPIGADLAPSRVSAILEEYRIDIALFGHLHSVKREVPLFGKREGVHYLLTSCDYLDFTPLRVL